MSESKEQLYKDAKLCYRMWGKKQDVKNVKKVCNELRKQMKINIGNFLLDQNPFFIKPNNKGLTWKNI